MLNGGDVRGIAPIPPRLLAKGSRLTLVPPRADGSLPEGGEPGGGSPGDESVGTSVASPAGAEERPEVDVVPEEETKPRRYPSTVGGALYLGVLAAMVAALLIVSLGPWRVGVHWLSGALIVAALLRAALRSRDAGMLAVRGRWFDIVLLALVGVALWILGTSVPDA